MSFWEVLKGKSRDIRGRLVGKPEGEEELNVPVLRRQILDQLVLRAAASNSGTHPDGQIVIRLRPRDHEQRARLEEAFLRENALEKYLVHSLQGLQGQWGESLQARVELQEPSSSGAKHLGALFEIDFVKADSTSRCDIPEVSLRVTRGMAEQPEYRMQKARILIGRPAEVVDHEGRIVRKNDVVFLESDDEIGLSVGSAHARIWHDAQRQGFWVMDEGSRYGTRIVRSGKVLEVPGGDPSGIQLMGGDDLFFGQAGIRFELTH